MHCPCCSYRMDNEVLHTRSVATEFASQIYGQQRLYRIHDFMENPLAEDRDLSMEDYRKLGLDGCDQRHYGANACRQINAAGYCLGAPCCRLWRLAWHVTATNVLPVSVCLHRRSILKSLENYLCSLMRAKSFSGSHHVGPGLS